MPARGTQDQISHEIDNIEPASEGQRPSPLVPARCSPAVATKAGRKRPPDNIPLHSFRSLFADLGTLTANTMQAAGGAAFTIQTQPTPVQQHCFQLLGATPKA